MFFKVLLLVYGYYSYKVSVWLKVCQKTLLYTTIVDRYNNTKHRTIKMKPIDIKDNTYINIDKEVNDNNSKFKCKCKCRLDASVCSNKQR